MGQTIIKKGFDLNAENGTLLGFIAGVIIPIVLMLLTGGSFGLFSLIFYMILSLVGVISFALYNSGRKQGQVFWAGLMFLCSFIMLFVLSVAVVINIGLIIGSGLLLFKSLSSLQDM